ncbi:phosphate uptake regulator PhoU [Candidatus Bathyarchaeota archaeon]|nr:phosphate uptake regulator PhoU [Candidatus Bathyarchaeota archaeon]
MRVVEKRKIQLVGKSTLTVSLPNAWVKKLDLKKGDFVSIIMENNSSLTILKSSESLEAPKTCLINSDIYQEKESIKRLIIADYVNGFDIIKVISSKRIGNNVIQAIREAESRLIGLNVVEETPSCVTLQCSINLASFPIDVVIRRLYMIFLIMLDGVIQALKDLNLELVEETKQREYEANRMYLLILRLLNEAQKIGISGVEDVLTITIVASALERMADWANKIAEEIEKIEEEGIEVSEKTKNTIENYYKRIRELSEKAIKSIMNNDANLANTLINNFKGGLDTEAYSIIRDIPTSTFEACLLGRVIWNLQRIGEIIVTIAEAAIDKAVRKEFSIIKLPEFNADLKELTI